jgi:hypothetical protein
MCCIQFCIHRWTLYPNYSTYESNVTKLRGNSFQPVHEEFSVMRKLPNKPSDRYNRCYPFMLCNMCKELTLIITSHKSWKGPWQCEYMGCNNIVYYWILFMATPRNSVSGWTERWRPWCGCERKRVLSAGGDTTLQLFFHHTCFYTSHPLCTMSSRFSMWSGDRIQDTKNTISFTKFVKTVSPSKKTSWCSCISLWPKVRSLNMSQQHNAHNL